MIKIREMLLDTLSVKLELVFSYLDELMKKTYARQLRWPLKLVANNDWNLIFTLLNNKPLIF